MQHRGGQLTKKSVQRTLREMPDSFRTEDLIERLILLSKIEAGLADAKTGRTLTIDEMREHIRAKWSK
ncbi:MAG: hypothetical protein WAT74_09760 [Flavobacteriales bacterium]